MSLEYYKKKMVDLRADLAKEREAKTKDNAHYANLIKSTSSASSKASYRKSKIDRAASHDLKIERLKCNIESCKSDIAREKKKK